MLVPEEQSILSASAVYLWQRIKARKIKHFLISPENLLFSNLETPILENPFFFFPSAERISDTTSLSRSPNTRLKTEGSDEGADVNTKILKLQL